MKNKKKCNHKYILADNFNVYGTGLVGYSIEHKKIILSCEKCGHIIVKKIKYGG